MPTSNIFTTPDPLATTAHATPDDFESEITLAAGNIVVRMQYSDGGGSDRRGDYRYEIKVGDETLYGDELQSPRGGFEHAADSVEAFRAMACSMLSFVTTDDPEATFRAPESMQSALEDAVCEVSLSEDGRDDPTGWTLVDHDSLDEAARALIAWKIANGMGEMEAATLESTGNEHEIDGETWRVLTDSEAHELAGELYWQDAWCTLGAECLADYIPGGHVVGVMLDEARKGGRGEDMNDAIQALIIAGRGKDVFVRAMIELGGREHKIATYDGEEQVQEVDDVTYYLYRTN